MGRGEKRAGKGGDRSGAQKKGRYWPSDKAGKKAGSLPQVGTRGFLISCETGLEGPAVGEALRALFEFYERLVPEGQRYKGPAGPKEEQDAGESEPAEGEVAAGEAAEGEAGTGRAGEDEAGGGKAAKPPQDFEAALAEEAAELTDRSAKVFRAMKTGIGGLIFVTMMGEYEPGAVGPREVAKALMDDVAATKQLRSRLCMRFMPIDIVCGADIQSICAAAAAVLPRYFPADGPGVTFACQYEHRASKNLDRTQVIDTLATAVPKPPHSVNLSAPDKTIMAQLLKTVCCLSVMDRFPQLGKYNIRSIVNPPERQPEKKKDELKEDEEKEEKGGEGKGKEEGGDAAAAPAAAGKEQGKE